MLQAMELKAIAGITQKFGAGRVGRLKVKELWIQEKVRSHALKISQVKSEDNRADLLTMFLDQKDIKNWSNYFHRVCQEQGTEEKTQWAARC